MIRSLSPREALVVLPLEERGQEIVTLSDIVSILKCDIKTAYYVAYRLQEKQWLFRIKQGKYLFIPAKKGISGVPSMNPYICAHLLKEPYYFSYSTATSHYGWTSLLSDVLYVATLHQQSIKAFYVTVKPVRITKHKLFGYTKQRVFSTEVNMASKEKAVVDAVDKIKNSGGIENVAKALVRAKRQVDWELVIDYAKRMQSKSLISRLGYLLEKLSITPLPFGKPRVPHPVIEAATQKGGKVGVSASEGATIVEGRLIDALAPNLPSCYVHLASPKRWGRRGKTNKEWHIIENVPDDKLLSEVTIR